MRLPTNAFFLSNRFVAAVLLPDINPIAQLLKGIYGFVYSTLGEDCAVSPCGRPQQLEEIGHGSGFLDQLFRWGRPRFGFARRLALGLG